MAQASVAHITRPNVGHALRQFRLTYAGSSREVNALNRAALNLEACVWQFDGDQLSIESATQTGTVRYHVQFDACDCAASKAGRACWHRAAYRLLHKAVELAQQAQQPQPRTRKYSDAQYARILAEAAELCG